MELKAFCFMEKSARNPDCKTLKNVFLSISPSIFSIPPNNLSSHLIKSYIWKKSNNITIIPESFRKVN